jgi:hypothetical protein
VVALISGQPVVPLLKVTVHMFKQQSVAERTDGALFASCSRDCWRSEHDCHRSCTPVFLPMLARRITSLWSTPPQ